jgi:hypothetical protein
MHRLVSFLRTQVSCRALVALVVVGVAVGGALVKAGFGEGRTLNPAPGNAREVVGPILSGLPEDEFTLIVTLPSLQPGDYLLLGDADVDFIFGTADTQAEARWSCSMNVVTGTLERSVDGTEATAPAMALGNAGVVALGSLTALGTAEITQTSDVELTCIATSTAPDPANTWRVRGRIIAEKLVNTTITRLTG